MVNFRILGIVSIALLVLVCTVGAATANFYVAPSTGTAPLAVSFIDQSAGATKWSWDFGDGQHQILTSGGSTTHTYTQIGGYTITLTINGGVSKKTLTNVVMVFPPSTPIATQTSEPTTTSTAEIPTFAPTPVIPIITESTTIPTPIISTSTPYPTFTTVIPTPTPQPISTPVPTPTRDISGVPTFAQPAPTPVPTQLIYYQPTVIETPPIVQKSQMTFAINIPDVMMVNWLNGYSFQYGTSTYVFRSR